jgi:hypothetical protein
VCHYLVNAFVHPWTKATRKRDSSSITAAILRPQRFATLASVTELRTAPSNDWMPP